MSLKNLLFIAGASLILSYADANAKNVQDLNSVLWQNYSKEKDNALRVNILTEIGRNYFLLNELNNRDSVFNMAVELAQAANNDTLEERIYENYFSVPDYTNQNTAESFAKRMLALAGNSNKNKWSYEAYAAIAKISLGERNTDKAITAANAALRYVVLTNEEVSLAYCDILMGSCYESANEKIEAFRQYSNALFIANKTDDTSLLYVCYQHLSSFYRLIGNYDLALNFKNRQFTLLTANDMIDSFRLMSLKNDLAYIYYIQGREKIGLDITRSVINFAMHNGYVKLKNDAFGIYRSYLVQNGLFKELYAFYHDDYPAELKYIEVNDTTLFYRLNAYIEEVAGKIDSSKLYYSLAEKRLLAENNGDIFLSNFYIRYGQFYLRNNGPDSAKKKFLEAYNHAYRAHYFPFLIQTSGYLDSINNAGHNFEEAYLYSKRNKTYSDSQALVVKGDELLRIEINNEEKQHELVTEKEKRRTELRHSIQYIAITICITLLFIILAMLGSFKVPKIWIKMVGFFSFVLLFEFIVMVTDTKVEVYTHQEPYKILIFKILIIILIAPIHHWLEHKVLGYLYEHKLIDTSRLSVKRVLSSVKKKPKPDSARHE